MDLRLQDSLRGKHIVLTGVTGFVAKVYAGMILDHLPDIGRITVLVRPGRKGAAARVSEILNTNPVFRPIRTRLGTDYAAYVSSKIVPLDADLAKPQAGLSPTGLAEVATADIVVHVAGLTDFQPDPLKAIAVNTRGARHAADLAALTRSGKLLQVSTCYTAGTQHGPHAEAITPGRSPNGHSFHPDRVVDKLWDALQSIPNAQDRIDRAMVEADYLGWPNLYTFSKGMAEHSLSLRKDVDLVIARPSVVECAMDYPFKGWNEGLNTSGPIMWYCASPFPDFPSTAAHHFDIIPVDAVARWLVALTALHLNDNAEPVYQLASSGAAPVTFERIVELQNLGNRLHRTRRGATPMERLLRHMDASHSHADDERILSPKGLKELTNRARTRVAKLQDGKLGRFDAVRKLRRKLDRSARTLARLEKMLKVYRPFVHDWDYAFETDRIESLMDSVDHPFFRFSMNGFDWRNYWLNVQYPGVVKWSWPIMDGKRPPVDPPAQPAVQLSTAERARGAA